MYNEIFIKLKYILNKSQFRSFIILTILFVISAVLETFSIGLIVPLITFILNPDSFYQISFLKNLIIFFNINSHTSIITISLILFTSVFFVKFIFLTFTAWKEVLFLYKFQESLSFGIFKRYIYQPYPFHVKNNTAKLQRNIVGELVQFSFFMGGLISFLSNIFVFVGLFLLLLFFEIIGSIILFISMGVLAYLFYFIMKSKITKWGNLRLISERLRIQYVLQAFGGIKDIKVLNVEENILNYYASPNYETHRMNMYAAFVQYLPRIFLEVLTIIAFVILFSIFLFRVPSLISYIPILGLFAASAFRMLPSLNRVLVSLQVIRSNLPVFNMVFNAMKLDIKDEKIEIKDFSFLNKIRFENVSFKYPDKKHNVFTNLNFEILSGQSVGIVGKSGSGKSTLIDLTLGLIKPSDGKILIDEKNLELVVNSWTKQIGYVPQEIYFTDDSILNNIALGIKQTKINREKINNVLQQVELKAFVEDLPEGINTRIGERGINLSSGQRQRIGIARALYNDPQILIFDEATSALDEKTENNIMNCIYNMKDNKTIIIASHRLSTLKNCNLFIEVNNNKIIQHYKYPKSILLE